MQSLEEAIRERAYHLWIADGRQDRRSDAYWITAQREILAISIADCTFESPMRISSETNDLKYLAKKAKVAAAARKAKRRAA